MDIYLRQFDNPNDFIKFPVVPKGVSVNQEQKIENFEALDIGDLKLIGTMGNRKLTISSFFPVKDYPFLKDRAYKGMEYIDKIQAWRTSRKPLKINVSGLNAVMNCVIESLDYGIKDGSGDVYYTITVEEYKTPEINKIKLKERKVRINTAPTAVITSEKSKYKKKKKNVKRIAVRSGKDLGYDIITHIEDASKIKILKEEGDYAKIKTGIQVGYIIKKALVGGA